MEQEKGSWRKKKELTFHFFEVTSTYGKLCKKLFGIPEAVRGQVEVFDFVWQDCGVPLLPAGDGDVVAGLVVAIQNILHPRNALCRVGRKGNWSFCSHLSFWIRFFEEKKASRRKFRVFDNNCRIESRNSTFFCKNVIFESVFLACHH